VNAPDSNETAATLTVAMTAFNSVRTIGRAIDSVAGLADRIVVVDSGSTDGTVEACRERGAEVISRAWPGYVEQNQFALDQCRTSAWILLLDSDESLEPDLRRSVRQAVTESDPGVDGWTINRKVWFLGGWLHHTYQPDRVLRLVRGDRARVVAATGAGEGPSGVHERLEVPGRVGRLVGVCRHDSWADLNDLAARQIDYARAAAEQAGGGGTPLHLLVNPVASMFKQLVIKRGALDGARGLIAAGLTFNATMLKHAFIAARRLRRREAGA
jgi:glycosyltransferase involved in cell wall biosynthesis